MRSLERDREKRFPSCAAFADALEAAAALKDKVASPRELAAYVNEVMGQEIAQQRDNVRSWLAQSEPTGAAASDLPPGAIPSSSVSAAAISIPRSPEASQSGASGSGSLSTVQQPKRSRTPLVLGALLLVGLLGAGGFMVTRSARSTGAASGPHGEPNPAPALTPSVGPARAVEALPAQPPSAAPSAVSQPPTAGSALGVVPLEPKPATRAPAPVRPRRKKPSDDVDLRNPYR
jgi:serine/threonine-protein kinase